MQSRISLGLIDKIPGTYIAKAVHRTTDDHPLRLGINEDGVKQCPTLCLTKLGGEHTIHLKEWAVPFPFTMARRVLLPLMKKLQEIIERMQQLDVLKQVDEPTKWCSLIVVVPKAD